jgi:nitrate/TMAO reductase-like tetraheme cytochrome c subunit
MSVPEDPRRGLGAWLWRRPRRWFLLGIPAGAVLALLAGVGLSAAFAVGLQVTESNAFCTSCHEMSPVYQELQRSVHYSNVLGIRASCSSCHMPPTFFAGLARHIAAWHDGWNHLTGEIDTPAKFEAHRLELAQSMWKELKANNSAECRSCHNPAAMDLAKQPPMAASAHAALASSGMTCIDCHKGVAHTLPAGG